MPALRLFGRRWHLASDDLPVPAAVLAAFHLVWSALLIVWAVYIHGPSDCDSAWNYDLCVGGLLGAFALSFILEVLIARASFQGSIFETQRRRQVPRLIYFNCASVIAQIGFNGYGTHLIYTEPPHCEIKEGEHWNPVDTMKGLVWSTWAIISMLVILVVFSYNLFPNFEDPKSWEQHCRCIGWWCCCCDKEDTFKGEEEEQGDSTLLSRLGRLFGMMFSHIDMTPSDIVVAFALAMTRQRIQRSAAEQAAAHGGQPQPHQQLTLGRKPQRPQLWRPIWGRHWGRRRKGELAAAAAAAVAEHGREEEEEEEEEEERHPRQQQGAGRHGGASGSTAARQRRGGGGGGGRLPPVLRKGSLQLTASASPTRDGGAAKAGGGIGPWGWQESASEDTSRTPSPSSPRNTDPLMAGYRSYEQLLQGPGAVLDGASSSSSMPAGVAGAGQGGRSAAAAGSVGAADDQAGVLVPGGELRLDIGPDADPVPVAAAGAAAAAAAGGPLQSRRRGGSAAALASASADVDLEQGQTPGANGTADSMHTCSAIPSRPVGDSLAIGSLRTGETEEHLPVPGNEERGELGNASMADVEEAAHYCRFAFAAYGWMLSIYRKPGVGWLELCCGRSCGFLLGMLCPDLLFSHRRQYQRGLRRSRVPVPVPDLRLAANLNREAIQQAAGLSNADLCYVRYEGDAPNVLPYFIGLDESAQEVVLAIRGSLSLEDCVRDLLFEPADLDGWVDNRRQWHELPPEVRLAGPSTRAAAHSGILEAARATLLDIQGAEVLHSLLLAPGAQCAGWRLVLAGHSLGAGCAFLLGLYLRTYFPNLRCWAFSPPGGLASPEVGAAAAPWCTSVVCGKEWIPRLTVATFNRMRDEMVDAAARCRLPKLRVVAGLLRGRRWREDELFYAPGEPLPQDAADALAAYHHSVRSSAGSLMDRILHTAGRFTVPGGVMHLKPVGAQVTGRWRRHKRRQYRAVWIQAQAIADEGVLISGRMMADHMPNYLLATLQRLVKVMHRGGTTASVGDAAGQQMVEHMMEGGQQGEENGSEVAPSERTD